MRRYQSNLVVGTIGFIVGVASCASLAYKVNRVVIRENYDVYVDPAFGPTKTKSVMKAMEAWQNATKHTDHPVSFHSFTNRWQMCGGYYTCMPGTITIHPESKINIAIMFGGPDAIGLKDRNENIFIDAELSNEALEKVLLHEFGHSLGLDHSDKNTVMCADIECMSANITDADVEQYNELRQ